MECPHAQSFIENGNDVPLVVPVIDGTPAEIEAIEQALSARVARFPGFRGTTITEKGELGYIVNPKQLNTFEDAVFSTIERAKCAPVQGIKSNIAA